MDTINILLKINNSNVKYAEALAGHIAENYPGISIASGSDGSGCNDGSRYDFVLDEIDFDYQKKLGVAKLIDKLKSEFSEHDLHARYFHGFDPPVYVGCIGVSGGAGTSAVALGIARELSRYREKRTLYLSFEEIESDNEAGEDKIVTIESDNESGEDTEVKKDCRTLVYYLIQNRVEDVAYFFETYTVKDEYGVYRIAQSTNTNELARLEPREIDRLIVSIQNSGLYDYVVFDLANRPPCVENPIFNRLDGVALIDRCDTIKKAGAFTIKRLIEEIKSDIAIVEVRNFCDPDGRVYDELNDKSEGIMADKIEIIREGNRLSLAVAFGHSIKEIVEQLNG